MEKEEKQQHHHGIDLQWGKRLRRFKEPSKSSSFGITRRKMSSRLVYDTTTPTTTTDPTFSSLSCLTRVTEGSRHGKSPSPDKEERYYSTRGSAAGDEKENGNGNGVGFGIGMGGKEKRKGKGKGNGNGVWPKLYISLSSKEKEEDFLAMKGCKLPQRPKKRAKLIQRTLLLVSPGAWLTDMCQERYEVREKKTPKKRPRGLKAMGNIVDSDTE